MRSSCRPWPPIRRTAPEPDPLDTTLAIVLAAGLVGGAIVLTRKREDEEGAGVCSQLAAVDPKLGAACAGLPILGEVVKRLGAYAEDLGGAASHAVEGAGDAVKGALGAPGAVAGSLFGGGDSGDLFGDVVCVQLETQAKRGSVEAQAKLAELRAKGLCL